MYLNTLLFYMFEHTFWMRVCLPLLLVLTAGVTFVPMEKIRCGNDTDAGRDRGDTTYTSMSDVVLSPEDKV